MGGENLKKWWADYVLWPNNTQQGPGKLMAPLSTTYSPLLSVFRFPPQCDISVGVTLAWYQQAGRWLKVR
jgi:hypothetical protein